MLPAVWGWDESVVGAKRAVEPRTFTVQSKGLNSVQLVSSLDQDLHSHWNLWGCIVTALQQNPFSQAVPSQTMQSHRPEQCAKSLHLSHRGLLVFIWTQAEVCFCSYFIWLNWREHLLYFPKPEVMLLCTLVYSACVTRPTEKQRGADSMYIFIPPTSSEL